MSKNSWMQYRGKMGGGGEGEGMLLGEVSGAKVDRQWLSFQPNVLLETNQHKGVWSDLLCLLSIWAYLIFTQWGLPVTQLHAGGNQPNTGDHEGQWTKLRQQYFTTSHSQPVALFPGLSHCVFVFTLLHWRETGFHFCTTGEGCKQKSKKQERPGMKKGEMGEAWDKMPGWRK